MLYTKLPNFIKEVVAEDKVEEVVKFTNPHTGHVVIDIVLVDGGIQRWSKVKGQWAIVWEGSE